MADVESAHESDESPTQLDTLPPELLAQIFSHLTTPVGLMAATATCHAAKQALAVHGPTVWAGMLAAPHLAPYDKPDVGPPGPLRCRGAMTLRRAWHSAWYRQKLYAYRMYVRCVRMHWPSRSFACGLYDGEVVISHLDTELVAGGEGTYLPTRHERGEVIALALGATVLVSGSGEPRYNREACPQATLCFHDLASKTGFPAKTVGAADGGHTDSVNEVLLLGDDEELALSAGEDGVLIVWECASAKPRHRCRVRVAPLPGSSSLPDCAVRSVVPVPGTTRVLAASADGVVRDWDWASGVLFGRTDVQWLHVQPRRLTALSFHAPTHTIALGDEGGCLNVSKCFYRRAATNLGAAAWQSGEEGTARRIVLVQIGEVLPGQATPQRPFPVNACDVASVRHDGDKIVCAMRSGEFRVARVGPSSNHTHEARLNVDVPHWRFEFTLDARVRMYVSSVNYSADVLVSDGFDNRVLVIFVGEGARSEPSSPGESGGDSD